MRALILGEENLELVDLPDPQPGPDEVVVAVHSCGICGSDVHLLSSDADMRGQVLGHELSGTIAVVGRDVEGWAIGQPVAVDPLIACGACEACRLGYPLMCPNAPNLGISAPGGLAELVAVPRQQLVALPSAVDVELGAHAEPLAVALRALDLAAAPPGSDALVYGIGPIGLNVILALRAAGAGRIVAVGRSAGRRAAASAVGADVVLDAREVDVAAFAAAEDLRFLQAYDCSGASDAIAAITPTLGMGATLVELGLPLAPSPVAARAFVDRGLRLVGSSAYSHAVYERAVLMLSTGALDPRPLVTERVPLGSAPEAFDQMRHPRELVGVVVQPWR